MERITAPDGVQICVQLEGAGDQPPVLVLPGGPCRDPAYLGDLTGLAAVRPLAVLHPRGTPATGGLSRGWWNDAADAIAVADALGLPGFDILAHSAGTRLALAAAAQFPGRVRSMALVTPAAAWLTGAVHDGPDLAARRSEPLVDAALTSMSGVQPGTEDEFQHALKVEAPAGYARWAAPERQHSGVGAMTLAAASAWFNQIPGDAAARILASPQPPTLVVGGQEDILSSVGPVRAYANALGAELAFLPDCGHYPWIEQPEAFVRIMEGWLRIPAAG
ncbi:alpha/beta hydrolase [Arthrobacter sp. zg-Y40]|uniref:alpha/beta fold hydrolase n=1 Tax=Arthrobacter sp. zg-Y40 TaxID=2886939 RepID=UPI001D139A4E|nr:alpha/beta hydrolase [Arthrobacter sp. zg-Y40]MCC3280667.1 alpha/beta hydrolase [Arthrobacter sp. zg-Y40]